MVRNDWRSDALLVVGGVLAGYLILVAASGLYYQNMRERVGFMSWKPMSNQELVTIQNSI